MSENPRQLLADILRDEIEKLRKIQQEVVENQAEFSDHDPKSLRDLRGLASVLADIYQGAENAFQRVVRTTKEGLPSGGEWHRLLLDQMAREVTGVRPLVITSQTRQALEDFRKFRHLARHLYGFDLNWEEIRPLLQTAEPTIILLAKDLETFCLFLEELNEDEN